MTMLYKTPQIVSRNRGGLRQCVKSLIFGAPEPITTSERDNPQEAASLLRRLPFEIRAQIWSEYFHGTTNKKLAHISPYGKSATDCVAKDWQSPSTKAHIQCYYSKQKCDCLSLLLTCRWL
ncbi:hypothetical protein LIA77_03259 [Sarocladium implicatum]|nr:hypothetical protein LIA77_03259 [Sarocladium implicatum]